MTCTLAAYTLTAVLVGTLIYQCYDPYGQRPRWRTWLAALGYGAAWPVCLIYCTAVLLVEYYRTD